jgi:hypothetical protein
MTNKELLQTYSDNAKAFIVAAKSLSVQELNHQKDNDQWSPAYVIHHMADAEQQFSVRFANTLADEKPPIVLFNEEKFPLGLKYAERSVAISIAAFEATHNLSYQILQFTEPKDWERTSIHPEKGEVTLSLLVEYCSSHIGAHIAQLRN